MVFNPSKFNFAKSEVEFAGLMLGANNIRPTDSYKEAILNFPAPKNVSEVRSWFGLINQVAYCFSVSTIMAPFRDLLKTKPPVLFLWTPELEIAFQESKLEIVRLVEEGVKCFDTSLVTCVSPNFCKSGLGWVLQQKICQCEGITPVCCKTGWRLVFGGGKVYHSSRGQVLSYRRGVSDQIQTSLSADRFG